MFRYLGNKSNLLEPIEAFMAERGLTDGVLCDIFAGSGAVGSHFKAAGWGVLANDFLSCSYVIQRALIGCCQAPSFRGVLGNESKAGEAFAAVLEQLNDLPGRAGIITRAHSPEAERPRRYFRTENAGRIDAVLAQIEEWQQEDRLTDDEFYLLLASLLKAADRVANVSGQYAAYLKSWQTNALNDLDLRPFDIIESDRPCRAYQEDANRLIGRLECDVLYIDPPYNHRQYAPNYHVLEVIAEHHTIDDHEAYLERLYGKTGMRPYHDEQLSAYNRQRNRESPDGPCQKAFRQLVRASRAEHIVVSYNEEGIMPREAIGDALAGFMGVDEYPFDEHFEAVRYRRFRSDSDEEGRRSYRVLKGKKRDEIDEWLFYARRDPEMEPLRKPVGGFSGVV